LTTGGNGSEYLTITDDAKMVLDTTKKDREKKQIIFTLAIQSFDVFERLYEQLKERRWPAENFLRDAIMGLGVDESDCEIAGEVFYANARYLGLIRELSGSDNLISLEHMLDELPDVDNAHNEPETDNFNQDVPDVNRQTPSVNPSMPSASSVPSVHIDVQIHIDSSASAEQIDQIFSSMARHLYGRETS
jgi:hypothetical protein